MLFTQSIRAYMPYVTVAVLNGDLSFVRSANVRAAQALMDNTKRGN